MSKLDVSVFKDNETW